MHGGQPLLKRGQSHGCHHVADDEDGEGDGARQQDQAHVAVDGTFISGCDDGPGVANGPNPCGDVGDGNQHEAVKAEGGKRVSGFHTVGLAVPCPSTT